MPPKADKRDQVKNSLRAEKGHLTRIRKSLENVIDTTDPRTVQSTAAKSTEITKILEKLSEQMAGRW